MDVISYIIKKKKLNLIVYKENFDQNMNLRVDLLMKENGQVIKEMDKEFKFGLMELNILVNGRIIKLVDKEHSIIQMELFMKDNGKMIEQMDMESIDNQMVLYTLDNGKMIINMDKVKKNVYQYS